MKALKNVVPEHFWGAVQVVQQGKVLFEKAQGLACEKQQRENLLDTKFAIASGGKTFVAVAILKLVGLGKIALDQNVGDILDEAAFDGVTVHQLLCYTSGIVDYFDEDEIETTYAKLAEAVKPINEIGKISELFPYIVKLQEGKPVATKLVYNNAGYIVLGAIIERVTGKCFDAYVKEVVFKPAGMTDTDHFEVANLPENHAVGYAFDEDSETYSLAASELPAKPLSDGGASTTTADLAKFWNALLSGNLIGKKYVEQMFAKQSQSEPDEDGDVNSYGYGVWLMGAKGDKPAMMGYDAGANFISYVDLEKDFHVTAMSNYMHGVFDIVSEVREIL